jgi:hypothetical protein
VTPSPLPLADASTRLRGKPGRPPTALPRPPRAPRARVLRTSAPTPEPPPERAPEAAVPVLWRFPRVLDLEGAAAYLSLSPWTVRALRAAGELAALEVPGVRRLLFDRASLDAAVTRWSARES